MATRLSNIGGAWYALGNSKKAKEYFKQAYDMIRGNVQRPVGGKNDNYHIIVFTNATSTDCDIQSISYPIIL